MLSKAATYERKHKANKLFRAEEHTNRDEPEKVSKCQMSENVKNGKVGFEPQVQEIQNVN